MYRGQHVFVLGGANSAGQGALFFARYAAQVTIVVRKPGLWPAMSQYLVDKIKATPNISVMSGTEIVAAHGTTHLETLEVRDAGTGETRAVEANALFIFIGVAPHTEAFQSLLATDSKGFILTGADVRGPGRRWELDRDPMMFETSVPGVFAAGDVRANANRRIAAAVGEGSAAIFSVHQYLRSV
jgi:thioredoxin reductase (NADPH)